MDDLIYKRICPLCGNEFVTDKVMKKYCSDKCTVEAQKLSHKRWYKKAHRKPIEPIIMDEDWEV